MTNGLRNSTRDWRTLAVAGVALAWPGLATVAGAVKIWEGPGFTPIVRTLSARGQAAFPVPRLTAAPRIDGILDDAVWAKAATIRELAGATRKPAGRPEGLLSPGTQTLY